MELIVGHVYEMKKPRKGRALLPRLIQGINGDLIKSTTVPGGVRGRWSEYLSRRYFEEHVLRDITMSGTVP